LGLSLWLSIPSEIVGATVISLISEISVYKPLRRRNATPLIFIITSLGLYIILQNPILLTWVDDTKSISTGEAKVGNEIFVS
jgi:branched-chain amino acid transport system permease protein